ncbi:MAG: hypothetical protein FJ246_11015 [Nitrospira sp.]|nr:hypothetical protein [Nitrospira sp.]
MAELEGEFLAESLKSLQLLALLFVCECRRKKTLAGLSFAGGARPAAWDEFVDRFAARLSRLPEVERAYLIGSHLQSAEEIDLYCNETLQGLLSEHRALLGDIVCALESDPRLAKA